MALMLFGAFVAPRMCNVFALWMCDTLPCLVRDSLAVVLRTNLLALVIMQLMRSVWPSVGGGRAANFPWPFEGSWPCSWYGSLATELRRTTSLCCSVGGGECSS